MVRSRFSALSTILVMGLQNQRKKPLWLLSSNPQPTRPVNQLHGRELLPLPFNSHRVNHSVYNFIIALVAFFLCVNRLNSKCFAIEVSLFRRRPMGCLRGVHIMILRARSIAGAMLLFLFATSLPALAAGALPLIGKKKPAYDNSNGLKPTAAQNALIDKAILREKEVVKAVRDRAPLVETYIQNMKPDPVLYQVPETDQHFLARLTSAGSSTETNIRTIKATSVQKKVASSTSKTPSQPSQGSPTACDLPSTSPVSFK